MGVSSLLCVADLLELFVTAWMLWFGDIASLLIGEWGSPSSLSARMGQRKLPTMDWTPQGEGCRPVERLTALDGG